MLTHTETLTDFEATTRFIHRSNWIRAAVLGANDGILSTASIAIGVAAASASREPVVLAALAGMVAGALSMAAGEYVSVSSQTDIEQHDIAREKQELEDRPEIALRKLAKIYEARGLHPETAMQVATELTHHDALAAHVRDELGISEVTKANPVQAAIASGTSFISGGVLPLLVTMFLPMNYLEYYLYGFSILFLGLLGGASAKVGGASVKRAVTRITFWGTIAMCITALVGYWFGVNI